MFLIGARRSGTTLLRVLLDAHPEINFPRVSALELGLEQVRDDGTVPDSAEEFHNVLRSNLSFERNGYQIDESLNLHELLQDILNQAASRTDCSVFVSTVHRYYLRALHLWRNSRFVYLVRDGRDVARSRIALGWEGNYWCATAEWLEAEEHLEVLKEVIPADRILEVHFEDLVSSPEQTLTEVCGFCNIAYDPVMLDTIEKTHHGRPNPALAQRWRTELTETEIRLAEARLAPTLVSRGYALSGHAPLEVTSRMRRRLDRQSRWKNRWARVHIHGWRQVILEALTRTLGMPTWNRKLQLQMQLAQQPDASRDTETAVPETETESTPA